MGRMQPEILFEKFEIIEILKKDSGTSVYLANHIYLGKKIILKTLDTKVLNDNTVIERFKREAKILAKLDHPNLVKVLDFGNYNNYFYISFEYFKSKSLRDVIKENKLSVEKKTYLSIQLLKALNTAHQNNIIHRDIKPENILVNSELVLKIVDFGLALIKDDNVLTHKSTIVGTPGYMSPEQIRGEKSPQTDLFSAGIVIYELFTGTNPFIGDNVSETINNILNFEEDLLIPKLLFLPENIQSVIKVLLNKKLSERPKSASEVLKLFGVEETTQKSLIDYPVKKNITKLLKYAVVPLILIIIIVFWVIKPTHKNLFEKLNSPKSNNIQLKKSDGENQNQSKNSFNTNKNPVVKIKENKPQSNKIINDKSAKENINIPISNNSEKGIKTSKVSRLMIECSPWATIYIDGDSMDTTPLDKPLLLKPGRHILKLLNAAYPPIEKTIILKAGLTDSLKINLNDLVGKLVCNVEPWGKIYINGQFKGITPLPPIVLLPGIYMLKITNPNFKSMIKKITIKAKEVKNFNYHFDGND